MNLELIPLTRRFGELLRVGTIVDDTRGVSIPIEYVLTFSALVMLFTGLSGVFLSGVNDTQDQVVEQELERVAEEVAGELLRVDRIVSQTNDSDAIDETVVSGHVGLPSAVAESSYRMSVVNGTVVVTSRNIEYVIPVDLEHSVSVEGGSTTGDIYVSYNAAESSDIQIEGGMT